MTRTGARTLLTLPIAAALVVAACSAARLRGDRAGAGSFVGAWALADTEGDLFDVVVREDGTAVTNWSKGVAGARGERGEWSAATDGRKITLSYDSGWRDVISRDGDRYEKRSYGPGMPLDGPPTNAGRAFRVRGPLRPFVGVWRLTAEEDGAPFFVAMKSDGTARKTIAPSASGKWSVENGVALVEWSDGWRLAIEEDGNGFSQEEWHPGAAATAAPTSRFRCEPEGGVPAAPPGE